MPTGAANDVRQVEMPLHFHGNYVYDPDRTEHFVRHARPVIENKLPSPLGKTVLRIEKPTLGYYCSFRIDTMEF